jgi:hypothetical protein
MRRITGLYDGVEHVICEYEHGIIECPADLAALLRLPDHSLPTGDMLLEQCRILFEGTMQVREV